MKQLILILITSTGLLLFSGCATGYTRVSMVPEDTFGNYEVVEVPNLKIGQEVPDELKKRIPEIVVKSLQKEHLFNQVHQGKTATGNVLLCQGRLIQFNPGDRFWRWMAGPYLGTGKGSLIVNMKFVDKTSQRQLAECNFEGEIKGGFLGGGFEDTYKEIAKRIVQFIKTNV